MITLGEQIRAARKQKGYTQDALASMMNLSRQAISHWESGRTMPDAETLLKLSSILDYQFEASDAASPEVQDAPPIAQKFHTIASLEKNLLREKKKNQLLITILLAIVLATVLFFLIHGLLTISKSDIHMSVLDEPLYLENDTQQLGVIPGWEFTLAMHNESDVPFTPEQLTLLLYNEERIVDKAHITYSEMLPWMDSNKMNKKDSPLHWLFGVPQAELTHVEFVLQGMDDHGHELEFRTSAPLYCEYAP